MTPRILTSTRSSTLLAHLALLVPAITIRLSEAGAWRGLLIRDTRADTTYLRLICRNLLVSRSTPPRHYLIGAHCFDKTPSQGLLHNHRFPMAILPFCEDADEGEALYEMPWEVRVSGQCVESGLMMVRQGQPYAMEHCLEIHHAVHSLRPHMSISLADVTADPARPTRLGFDDLDDPSVARCRHRILAALRQSMDHIKWREDA